MGYKVQKMVPAHGKYESYKAVRQKINKSLSDFLRKVRKDREERLLKEKGLRAQLEAEEDEQRNII